MERYIIFKSNNQSFALGISKVDKIIEFQEPKPIPESSAYFLGVIKYNNKILPIIDLTRRLYSVNSPRNEADKVIVILCKNKLIGVVVDDIFGIQSFENEQFESSNEDAHISKEYILGFIKTDEDITIVLDTDKIFSLEQENELFSSTNV